LEEALRALMLARPPVTALVGTRINWGANPQGSALPAIVMNVIDDAAGLTLAGSDGLSQGRVQIDCYADTFAAAKITARAVIAALHGYSAPNGLRLIEHVATRDTREGSTNEADRPFRTSLDFMTHWRFT